VVLVNGLSTAPGNLVFGPDTTMCFVLGTVLVDVYAYVLAGLRFAWAAPLVGDIVGVDLAPCGHPRSLGGPGRPAVENHGPPLSPEDDAFFDLFASFRVLTDPASKRGLGLYLLRLIAERYGASARAEDIADGVRFKVLLPLRSPRSRPSVRKSRSDAPVDPEPERP